MMGLAAILAMTLMTGVWGLSLGMRDASIVDRIWGLGFALIAWGLFLADPTTHARMLLVVLMTTVWGARLSWHIHRRNHGKPEDERYVAMRARRPGRFWWWSLFGVFWLQGVVMLVVAVPVVAVMTDVGGPFGAATDYLGVFLWALGIFFEARGDVELARFRSDPANRGKVLSTGLWSLTRHPNYFGDMLVWWGIFTVSLSSSWGWASVVGPVTMTLFLRFISGVTLLESQMRARKPEYEAYMSRVPAFIPNPWKWWKYRRSLMLVLLAGGLAGAFAAEARAEVYPPKLWFSVYDPASGELLVVGEETIETRGEWREKTTLYRSLAGKELMRERVRYHQGTLALEFYQSEYFPSGEWAETTREGGKLCARYRPQREAPTQSRCEATWAEGVWSGKSLHDIFAREWKKLLKGKTVSMSVIIPSRMRTLDLDLHAVEGQGSEGTKAFRLEASSWLLRPFVPALEFVYREAWPPRLVSYLGPTTIPIGGDSSKNVRIEFHYEDPSAVRKTRELGGGR